MFLDVCGPLGGIYPHPSWNERIAQRNEFEMNAELAGIWRRLGFSQLSDVGESGNHSFQSFSTLLYSDYLTCSVIAGDDGSHGTDSRYSAGTVSSQMPILVLLLDLPPVKYCSIRDLL